MYQGTTKKEQVSGQQLVLVGNMNVGKTALFSKLTTQKHKPVNLPGSTVTLDAAPLLNRKGLLYDTPGNVSIFSENEDERATRELILNRGNRESITGIVLVADAKNLPRSLAIALQYGEFGLPIHLNINMMDEAVSRGIEVDLARVAKMLGIRVTSTIAPEGMGVRELSTSLDAMEPMGYRVTYTPAIEAYLEQISQLLGHGKISPRALGLLMLHGDRDARTHILHVHGETSLREVEEVTRLFHLHTPQDIRKILTEHYFALGRRIADEVQDVEPKLKSDWLSRFGDMCTAFSTGIPIAFLVLTAMYYFIGAFGATYLVDTLNTRLFEGIFFPFMNQVAEKIPSVFIRDMLMDPDFGIIPTGVFLAMGLVLPVIFCFYIAFGVLEDSGYLPRISILLDNVFQKIGLNGKGAIPLVMGFSCVTMALLTTRVLNSEKEKIIASFLLYLCLPCAPLIAVMLIILDSMAFSATVVVFGVLLSQALFAGYFLNRLLPGVRTPLFLEIPPMRLPKPVAVIRMAVAKTWFFMLEALPVFILASLGVFLFERAGGLTLLEHTLGPMIHNVMGLPEKSVQVFIKTMIRREAGATELEHLRQIYTNLQLVVNLIVMTLLAPCINSFIVLFKERGIKTGLAINIGVFVYAIIIGSIVNHLCMVLGIQFSI